MTPWVSLFSGGKDSAWALFQALEAGHPVETLVTVHPPEGSFLFHVPATELAALAAESIRRPLLEVNSPIPPGAGADTTVQGDRELEPLEAALSTYQADRGLDGITAGAVASSYQFDRLSAMCDRLDCELYTPLWGSDPVAAGRAMVDVGFDIRIVAVAADGLDAAWLGRRLDHDALDDLETLNDVHGVHVLGEGGEYETLVVDGPHMERAIEFESSVQWNGTYGVLQIEEAWLSR